MMMILDFPFLPFETEIKWQCSQHLDLNVQCVLCVAHRERVVVE